VQATAPGPRLLRFELSRFLKVREVTADGKPVEFIQNEALQGTDLERRGNDLVSIVLPKAMEAGQRLRLHMVYGGDVLAQAGGGLMYVGAHGDWYPNRGLAMSNFNLEFHYPPGWTLIATGKRLSNSETATPVGGGAVKEQVARWISERPMPFAGFNLGKYEKASAKSGELEIDAYATQGVESTMRQQQTIIVIPGARHGMAAEEDLVLSTPPSPASNAERVAKEGARTVDFYARRMGPYPYSSLAITQMPGGDSQSWPGLIYLSSYVFLTSEERSNAHVSPIGNLMYQRLMQQHETAHQWWGDLLIWKSYREQWIVEGLSNYCALLKLEGEDQGKFREIMDRYRQDLLIKNAAGNEVNEAGPVTLGIRLNSSRFANGYITISYGRGTWLFHMLRSMYLTPAPEVGGTTTAVSGRASSPDEPFFRILRKLRERFEGKEITTRDVQKAFEEELPASLQYEGRKSLDWFFDGWVNGTSVPKFALSEVKFSSKTGATVVTGKILLKDATEGLVTSMPVYAASSGAPIMLGRVFVEGPETSFRFNVPPGNRKILLDPYQTILSRP
jgi:Peptidase family M1 domain